MRKIDHPNGDFSTGTSWSDLEAALRAREFRPMSLSAWRKDVARRAYLRCGKLVSPKGSARTFILALVRVGYFDLKEVEDWKGQPVNTAMSASTNPPRESGSTQAVVLD